MLFSQDLFLVCFVIILPLYITCKTILKSELLQEFLVIGENASFPGCE